MRISFSVFFVFLWFSSTTVSAGTITQFTDRPTFTGAVGGSLTIEDFTSSFHFPITTGILNSATNLPGLQNGGILPGDIQPGVTYSTPVGSGNFFNIDAGAGYVGGFLDGFNPRDRDVTITFDTPVSAFGFETGGSGGATDFDVTIRFTSGPDQVFNNPYPNQISFFGWQSNLSDIESVVVSNNGGSLGFDFDNFTFGGVPLNAVPEPASIAVWSLLLLLAGMTFVYIRCRKLQPVLH